MIEFATGNLLEADAEALVNAVNTVGVMGKGIALQFKQVFPEMYREYRAACEAGEVVLGRMHVVPTGRLFGPSYLISFPTKGNWREQSRLEDIRSGLEDLTATVEKLDIRSIALPPLGCGLGGLCWVEVRQLIEKAFDRLPEVRVLLYEPRETTVSTQWHLETIPNEGRA